MNERLRNKILFWFAMSTVGGIMFGLFIGYQIGAAEPQRLTFVGIIISLIFMVIAALRGEFLFNRNKTTVPEEGQKEPSKKLSPHNRRKANDENE
jgi:phosphotransferase system  glucose/maltose/N-acetylglucosamine-specific IIC component